MPQEQIGLILPAQAYFNFPMAGDGASSFGGTRWYSPAAAAGGPLDIDGWIIAPASSGQYADGERETQSR